MPGDLQMLWRAEDPKQYHVEYAFSCMGYEIAGALGIKMAAPEREVYSLVGDGSYLMMAQEIATAVSENIKLIVVIIQNHGIRSIGSFSESLGRNGSAPSTGSATTTAGCWTATSCPSTSPPTPNHWAPTSSGSPASRNSARVGPGPGGHAHHRRAHRDRSAGPGAVLGILVGRTGFRCLPIGQHPAGLQGLPAAQGHPTSAPHPRSPRRTTDEHRPPVTCPV